MRRGTLPEELKGFPMRLSDPNDLVGWLLLQRLTYAELGELAGVSKQFIGQLVTGHRNSCTAEVALRIEKVLLPPPGHRPPGTRPLFVPDSATGPTPKARLVKRQRPPRVEGWCQQGHNLADVGLTLRQRLWRCSACTESLTTMDQSPILSEASATVGQ